MRDKGDMMGSGDDDDDRLDEPDGPADSRMAGKGGRGLTIDRLAKKT